MAVGDDPVCHSSTVPQQSEFALMAAGIPVLAAGTVQEVYDYGLAGIALSRFAGLWVALKLVTDIAESTAVIDLDSPGSRIVVPADFVMPPDGVHLRVPDWPTFQEERLMRYRLPALQAAVRASGLDRVTLTSPQPRLGIVAFGKGCAALPTAWNSCSSSRKAGPSWRARSRTCCSPCRTGAARACTASGPPTASRSSPTTANSRHG
jgi:TPP-dependent indolepyruvate ferredoxin oxidoreductase alpha subunit